MSGSFDNSCPINEQTADGTTVGRCWFGLVNGQCRRHGDVSKYVEVYRETGQMTLENDMRRDRGLPLLGRRLVS